MTKTDTSEKGLERLICTALTGAGLANRPASRTWRASPPPFTVAAGWIWADAVDYDREYCVDLVQLRPFCRPRSRKRPRPSTSTRTARRGASSSPACRARSASAA